jgi:hypothetical protein
MVGSMKDAMHTCNAQPISHVCEGRYVHTRARARARARLCVAPKR